jgi:hypothetical protein
MLLIKNMTFAFWNYFIPLTPNYIYDPTNMNTTCNTLHIALIKKNEEKERTTKIVEFFFKLSV